ASSLGTRRETQGVGTRSSPPTRTLRGESFWPVSPRVLPASLRLSVRQAQLPDGASELHALPDGFILSAKGLFPRDHRVVDQLEAGQEGGCPYRKPKPADSDCESADTRSR